MVGSSTLNLIPGTTKFYHLRLSTKDNVMQMQVGIGIILIVNTKDGLTSKGEIFKTFILLVLASIVVKMIILDQNVDRTTELDEINVMSMDIRPDSVRIVHSNQ